MFARVKVILGSVVTKLTVLGAIIAIVFQQVATVVPAGYQDNVVAIGGLIAGVLTAAITTIRLVTPVIPDDVGILPPDRPADPTVTAASDADEVDSGLGLLEVIVILVVIAIFAIVVGWLPR